MRSAPEVNERGRLAAELETDRLLAHLPSVPLPDGALASWQAAALREFQRVRLRRIWVGRVSWLGAAAAGLLIFSLNRGATPQGVASPPPVQLPTIASADPEAELDAWDQAVRDSGERFAALLAGEVVETGPQRLDDAASERLFDSIERGLSLSQDGI